METESLLPSLQDPVTCVCRELSRTSLQFSILFICDFVTHYEVCYAESARGIYVILKLNLSKELNGNIDR